MMEHYLVKEDVCCAIRPATVVILTHQIGISVVLPMSNILSYIPMHTRSGDPYVSSLSEKKSIQHHYPCDISVSNAR